MQHTLSLTLGRELREVTRANKITSTFLEELGVGRGCAYRASLAVEEVLSNVIRHGIEETDRHELSLSVQVKDNAVELQFTDNGREFDPRTAPVVDVLAPLETRTVGGLGLHLLRTFCGDMQYQRKGGKNQLRVRIQEAQ